MKRYSKDAPFTDPIVRCDSCHKILVMDDVRKYGNCKYCGTRKVRNLLACNIEEIKEMEHLGIDPDFLALFEEVE